MTLLEQLLAMIKDDSKDAAKTLGDQIAAKIKDLDERLTSEEAKKLDAIKTRDAAKGRLAQIGSALQVGEEGDVLAALTALKASKKGDGQGDSVKDKEIEQLKGEIAKAKEGFNAERAKLSDDLLTLALERDVAAALPDFGAKKGATAYIMQHVKQKAKVENGKVVFKNEDGTALRIDTEDATVRSIIEKMKKDEIESGDPMFFDGRVQASGAGDAAGSSDDDDFQPV